MFLSEELLQEIMSVHRVMTKRMRGLQKTMQR